MTYTIQPQTTIEGYLYCIANDNYPEWIKVGQTSDPRGRLQTYNSYTPENNFYYLVSDKVPSYKIGEKSLIETFSKNCPSSSVKGAGSEWFKADHITAEKHFLDVVDNLEEYVCLYHIKQEKKIEQKIEEARKNRLEKEEARKKEKVQATVRETQRRLSEISCCIHTKENVKKEEGAAAEKKLLRALHKREKYQYKLNTKWMDEQEERGLMFASDYCISRWGVGSPLEPIGRFTGRIPTHMLNRYGLEKQC